MLTDDAAEMITTIVQKVNATEKMYPLEARSDLYVRVGVVYWAASKGILFRATSQKWRNERGSYLVQRAKAYFSKVMPSDDLYSISIRNLGLLCMDAEEWTEAEEHLSDALTHFPDDYRIGEALAKAHVMLGNQMEALTRLDEMLVQVERPELYVLKGRILKDLGRPEDAIECFTKAISLDPKYMPAHDIKIETLRGLRRTEEAAQAESQRALSSRPDLEKKISELIFEFKKAETAQAAQEPVAQGGISAQAERKPEAEPELAPSPMDPARKALDAGDFDGAIQKSSEVLSAQPDFDEAQLLIIEALVGKGSIGDASAKTREYYEKNHDDPLAWYWRGVVADKEGKWGASVQYFSKAVTLDPELVDAWVLMGEVLLGHGRQNGADESFSRAIALNEGNARAWLGKGKTMKELGRWGAAVQCLDKYTSLEPSDEAAWLLKADLLLEKGRYEKAIESYDKYLELAQDDSYALGRKGVALNSVGRTDEARKCLEESVRLDPNNKDAAKWLKSIQGGAT
jgi:tetratricopeptide (TPR) repeat protein